MVRGAGETYARRTELPYDDKLRGDEGEAGSRRFNKNVSLLTVIGVTASVIGLVEIFFPGAITNGIKTAYTFISNLK